MLTAPEVPASIPSAFAVRVSVPAETAASVHAQVDVPPAATVPPAAGTGPAVTVASAGSLKASDGETPVTAAPPVLVTVSRTSNDEPAPTCAEETDADAASNDAGRTVTDPEVPRTDIARPLPLSVPDAEAVNEQAPGPTAAYAQLNATDPCGTNEATPQGGGPSGPLTTDTTPEGAGPAPLDERMYQTAVLPVFETVIVTVTVWPCQTDDGDAEMLACSATSVADPEALATTGTPSAASVPVTVPVTVANPAALVP